MSIESVHALPSSRQPSASGRAEPQVSAHDPFPGIDDDDNDDKSSNVVEDVQPTPPDGRLFSPELAQARRAYFIILGRALALISILMWICLPVYWAALSSSAQRTTNLEAWYIDRDGSRVGQGLWQAFVNNTLPGPRLGWSMIRASDAGSDDQIAQMILNEQAWVAVVVEANATTRLTAARVNGDTTYNPASAITVYYAQARNEIATGNYVVPITTALLQYATEAFATSSAQRYFAQINAQGKVNDTAVGMLAQAPQTISPAISYTTMNLRPYTAPAAQAVTLVGNIFLCIFSFMITMAHSTARKLISPYLRTPSYLLIRIMTPLIAYVPLSMSYALVNLAFALPFDGRYSQSAGFLVFFVYAYLGMASLGLALEAVITLATPRFTPFFLFILIIFNVSPVVLPPELQPSFFVYGAGFPISNLSDAFRTILFNTESHLGRDAAVMVAWILLSCGTISLFTWGMRRRRSVLVQRLCGGKSSKEKTEEKLRHKGVEKSDMVGYA
ncbi:hypothetical protein OBBRIDRAFT_796525 [Obba rivulosa]|uniref:DUF3533 domain-containing protein n=1 Tax=Obba rivulosa TaxID=1052685 RepID=A0A8E2AM06_9APHY|nr:hypothetical protein OBBRIDRAFT_796525 [Obba rivulosa]